MFDSFQHHDKAVLICDCGVGATTLIGACVVNEVQQWVAAAADANRTIAVYSKNVRETHRMNTRVTSMLNNVCTPSVYNMERAQYTVGDKTCTVMFLPLSSRAQIGTMMPNAVYIDNMECMASSSCTNFSSNVLTPLVTTLAPEAIKVRAVFVVCSPLTMAIAMHACPDVFQQPIFGGWPSGIRSDGTRGTSLARHVVLALTSQLVHTMQSHSLFTDAALRE